MTTEKNNSVKKRSFIPWLFIASWFLVLALVVGTVYYGKPETNKWDELKQRKKGVGTPPAEAVSSMALTGLLTDIEGVLSAQQRESVVSMLQDVQAKQSISVGFVLLPSAAPARENSMAEDFQEAYLTFTKQNPSSKQVLLGWSVAKNELLLEGASFDPVDVTSVKNLLLSEKYDQAVAHVVQAVTTEK